MPPLPSAVQELFLALTPAFTQPTAWRMLWLTVGAVVATGRRTTCHILAGLRGVARGHHTTFHRLFSRARWNSLAAARRLAAAALDRLPEDGPVVLLVDDTTTEHPGRRVWGKDKHRDAVRSSRSAWKWRWGHRWVVLAVLAPVPGVTRPWAFPEPSALHRSPGLNAREGRRHRTTVQLAALLARLVVRWFPGRRFVLVADGGYGSHELARLGRRFPGRLTVVSKFHPRANLFGPPPRYAGSGRPREKGDRMPRPQEVVESAAGWNTTVGWYGGRQRRVRLVGGEGLWHHKGHGLVGVRWVHVADREGVHRPEYFFSTDRRMPLRRIVELYTRRWNIEVTFQEVRAKLGFGTTRVRCRRSVGRAEPWLLGVFTLVCLAYARAGRAGRAAWWPWYEKTEPTFADALATARRLAWGGMILVDPAFAPGVEKLRPEVRELLIETLSLAA
jgi:hypothetical protein